MRNFIFNLLLFSNLSLAYDEMLGFVDETTDLVLVSKKVSKKIFSSSKYGLIDFNTKKVILPVKYDKPIIFKEGLALVEKKGKLGFLGKEFGFIDRTGKIVIRLKFDKAWNFNEGLAVIEKKGKFGFIDKSGKIVIPLQFDMPPITIPFLEGGWAYRFSEGLAAVAKEDKWGFIDKTGKIVIPLQFYNIYSGFYGGLAKVSFDKIIDKNGKEILPEANNLTRDFFGKGIIRVRRVFFKNNNTGRIDKHFLIDVKTGKVIDSYDIKSQ